MHRADLLRAALPGAVAALLLVGCPSTYEYPPQDEDLLIGSLVDDRFEPWADGDEVEWVWGTQGGTMIQPVLSLDIDLVGDARQANLTLTNNPDPDFPEADGELETFSGFTAAIPLTEAGSVLLSAPLDDQLGWQEPSGVRLILEVTVSGDGFEASRSMPLKLEGDLPTPSVCDDLPTFGSGCVYRLIAGTGTVTAVAAGSGTPSCDERVAVDFDFAPADAAWGECYEGGETGSLNTADGRDPPSACVDQLGIAVGAELSVEFGHSIAGTCTPYQWFTDAALEGCDAICP